jgi:S1-C subfamily serine protease
MRTAALLVSFAAAAAYAQDSKKLCRAIVQVQTTDRNAERAQALGARVAGLKIHQPYTMVVSGVCISEKEILTPALHPRADLHVLVKYDDARVEEARVIGTDPLSNLALIEVAVASPEFLRVHAADVAVQQGIGIAGCPVQCREGKPRFLTGRVRADHVAIGIQDIYGVTETGRIVLGTAFAVDTIEGRPNVGAACVDKEGRLVGLVVGGLPTWLRPDPDHPGQWQHLEMRFAVPAARIERIVDSLRRRGRVVRADFGLALDSAGDALIAQFDLPKSAVAVTEFRGRPAADGFLLHDVIVNVDGKSYRDRYELGEALTEKVPGTPVSFDVLRRGKRVTVTATPVERE